MSQKTEMKQLEALKYNYSRLRYLGGGGGGGRIAQRVEKAPSTTNKSAIVQVSQSMTLQHYNPRKGMISTRTC